MRYLAVILLLAIASRGAISTGHDRAFGANWMPFMLKFWNSFHGLDQSEGREPSGHKAANGLRFLFPVNRTSSEGSEKEGQGEEGEADGDDGEGRDVSYGVYGGGEQFPLFDSFYRHKRQAGHQHCRADVECSSSECCMADPLNAASHTTVCWPREQNGNCGRPMACRTSRDCRSGETCTTTTVMNIPRQRGFRVGYCG